MEEENPDGGIERPKERRWSKAAQEKYERDKARENLPRVLTGPQCSAKRANGLPCKNRPIKGGSTCRIHGGAAPQVREKAEQRLLAAADKLMASLIEIALNKSEPTMARLAAIRDALNRAGLDNRGIQPQQGANAFDQAILSALGESPAGDVALDTGDLGGDDPIGDLEQAAYNAAQLARDAAEDNWRSIREEDAEQRIYPTTNTVRGEVVDSIIPDPSKGPPRQGSEQDPTPYPRQHDPEPRREPTDPPRYVDWEAREADKPRHGTRWAP